MGKQLVDTFDTQYSLETRRPDLTVNIGVTVKTGFKCQKGDVLGIITASGLARRRSRTAADAAGFSNASPVGVVEDASRFMDGDVVKKLDGTTVGTVAANGINTVTNQVTLTGNAAISVADGVVLVASDGSQTASVIAEEGSDGNGDTPINVITQSPALDISKLLGLDDSAITELGGRKLPGNTLKI